MVQSVLHYTLLAYKCSTVSAKASVHVVTYHQHSCCSTQCSLSMNVGPVRDSTDKTMLLRQPCNYCKGRRCVCVLYCVVFVGVLPAHLNFAWTGLRCQFATGGTIRSQTFRVGESQVDPRERDSGGTVKRMEERERSERVEEVVRRRQHPSSLLFGHKSAENGLEAGLHIRPK